MFDHAFLIATVVVACDSHLLPHLHIVAWEDPGFSVQASSPAVIVSSDTLEK